MKSVLVLAALFAALGVNAGEKSRLYPSDRFAYVRTKATSSWPGVHLDVKGDDLDLSPYGSLRLLVTNRSDQTLSVSLSVKNRSQQGKSPGGKLSLAPFAAGELVCELDPMPWQLDSPLELVGMNGVPLNGGKGGVFNLESVRSFHVFLRAGIDPAAIDVLAVTTGPKATRRKVLAAAGFLPFVDAFGQFKHDDWPGKVHSEADLVRDRDDEARWLEANAGGPQAGLDRFGGWTDGPQLKATGFFRVEKVDGKWWFVDPEGRLFWSHGVDCVHAASSSTGITFREGYFEGLPGRADPVYGKFYGRVSWPAAHGFYAETNHLPYVTFCHSSANMFRKYGADWRATAADIAHRRIRAWGLNTIANWSDENIYLKRRTPYTLCLGTGGAPRRKGSKGWWGPLPDPDTPEFENILRKRARAAAAKMKDDPWCLGIFVDNELSWNDLPDLDEVADRYFATVRKVLLQELPNHLYFGSRIAWGTPGVYRACARHCDVVSVNVYTRTFDRELPEGSVDRPMINGEFHFGALDRGLFHTGLVATHDQDDRARSYREYAWSCLDNPRVIGTHWFQWKDQPLTARADGENYQIGFLTVTDRPYPELVKAAREVGAGMYARRYGKGKGR